MTAEVVDLFAGSADILSCGAQDRVLDQLAATDSQFWLCNAEARMPTGWRRRSVLRAQEER